MLHARAFLLGVGFGLLALSASPSYGQDVESLEREFYALDFKVRQWERLQSENPRIVVPPGFPEEVARYRQLAGTLHVARMEQAIQIAQKEQAKESVFAALTGKKTVEGAVELLDAQITRLAAENDLVEKFASKKLVDAKDATSDVVQRFIQAWEPERKAQSLQEVKDIFVAHQLQVQRKLEDAQRRRAVLAGARLVLAGPGLREAIADDDFFGAAEKAIDAGTTLAETVYDEETFKAASARLGAGKAGLDAINKALSGDYLGSATQGIAAVDSLVADVSKDLARENGTLRILLDTDFQDPALNETARQLVNVSSDRAQKLARVHTLKQGLGAAQKVLGGVGTAWSWFSRVRSEVDSMRAIASVPGRSAETARLIASMAVVGRLIESGAEYLPPGLKEAVGPLLAFYGEALQLGDSIDAKIRDIYTKRGDCLNIQGGLQFDPKAVKTIESRWPRPDLCLKLAEEFQAAKLPLYVDDPDSRSRVEPAYFFIPDTNGEPTALTSAQYAELQRIAAAFGAYTTILQTGYALTASDVAAILAAIASGSDEFTINDGYFSDTRYRIRDLEERARILVRVREAVGEQLTPGNASELIDAWKAFESEADFASQLCSFRVFPNDLDRSRIFVNYLADRQALRAFVTKRQLVDPKSTCRARLVVQAPKTAEVGTAVQFSTELPRFMSEVHEPSIDWQIRNTVASPLNGPIVEIVFDQPGAYRVIAALSGRIGDQRLKLAEAVADIEIVAQGASETPPSPAPPAATVPTPVVPAPAAAPSAPESPASPRPATPQPPPASPGANQPSAAPPSTTPGASPASPSPKTPPAPPGPGSPALTPPPPSGASLPAAGPGNVLGQWTLVGAVDRQQVCEDWDEGEVGTAGEGAINHRVTIRGASVATSYTDVATKRTIHSSSTWTDLPQTVTIPGPAPSIDIRVQGDLVPKSGITPPGPCSGPARTVVQPGNFPVTSTGSWGGLGSALGTGSRGGDRKTISITHYGGGGSGTRTYTYEWRGGAGPALATTPAAPGFEVTIAVDKPALAVGDVATLSARVQGGTPPFRYAWDGAETGDAASLVFAPPQRGTHAFRLTVTDSKGALAKAAASVLAEPLTVSLRLLGAQGGRVVLGQSVGFAAALTAGGKAVSGAYVYRWQPHPAVDFQPFEGERSDTTGRFVRPERVAVWVEVLTRRKGALVTVGESPQIEVDVLKPTLKLRAEPASPLPGEEVRVSVTEEPPLDPGIASYWWELQGRAKNAGALADERHYSLKPADAQPVTVIVHARARDGGADLGQESLTIVPRRYDVRVTTRTLGMPSREWNPAGGGLRETSAGPRVFQDVLVRADVSPSPIDARYLWSISPPGCALSNEISQEPRVNCSEAGSYTATVVLRDREGSELGSGSGSFSIQAPPTPAPTPVRTDPDLERRETARRLRAEGEAFQAAGKLREAVDRYRESLRYFPDPRLEAHIAQVEAALAQEAQARETARRLRAEGEAFQNADRLEEAVSRYRESLKYLPDARLQAHILDLEAEIARRRAAQAAAPAPPASNPPQRTPTRSATPAAAAPAPSVAAAPARPPATEVAVDPKKREKALKLRAEGEKEEAKNKLKNAVEKYRKSLQEMSDDALARHVAELEPRAEQQEREKNAKRHADIGYAQEYLGLLSGAIDEFRKSLSYVDDPALTRHIADLERRMKAEEQEQRRAEARAAEEARRGGSGASSGSSGSSTGSSGTPSSSTGSTRGRPAEPSASAPQPSTPPPAPRSTPIAPAPQPPAPQRPQACDASGTYEVSGEGVTITFRLSQSGDRLSGTASGAGLSGSIEATRSGLNLSFRNSEGDTWTGILAADCSSMTITLTVDGETNSLTLSRR